jgi:hypothetical protein
MSATHIAYTDESNWNTGRFRSIAMISFSITERESIIKSISKALSDSKISEFEWKKLVSAKYRFCAERFINATFCLVKGHQMRVDVLIWDTEDSRHKIFLRDDEANLARMYFHIFKNVLKNRWPDQAKWRLYPDEHSCINWDNLHESLSYTQLLYENPGLFSSSNYRMILRQVYAIEEIEESKSDEKPIVQLADLFAGMACFSRECYDIYKDWEIANSKELLLFHDEEKKELKFSNSQMERFPVLCQFNHDCKVNKMGVSLDSSNGLRTHDPKNPINFWWYEPQHELDKAPVKNVENPKKD